MCNEITKVAATSADGSASLFKYLRRGGRQSLLSTKGVSSLFSTDRDHTEATALLANAMDHSVATGTENYSTTSASTTARQETAHSHLQQWFLQTAKIEQALPLFLQTALTRLSKLVSIRTERDERADVWASEGDDTPSSSSESSSSSSDGEYNNANANDSLSDSASSEGLSPPTMRAPRRRRKRSRSPESVVPGTNTNNKRHKPDQPPAASRAYEAMLFSDPDDDSVGSKDVSVYEPGANSFFALRPRSRKRGDHPAEVSGLIELVRGRANQSGIPFYRLRVEWMDRATPSIVYLKDVLCSRVDRQLPPVLVRWIEATIEADEGRSRPDIRLLKRWWATKKVT